MLTLRGTINDSSGARYVDAQAANGTLYTVTTQPRYRAYTLETMKEVATSSNLVAPSGIALFSGGVSACVTSSTSSQVDFIELTTAYRTSVSTGASTTVSNTISQQVAAQGLIAISTRSTTGTVQRINATTATPTVASVAVGALSGQTARCVIPKTGTDNWFIGTSDGKIHEIDLNGFVYQTITIPSTPAVSAPTIHVGNLSYYAPYILASTNHGSMYLYNYSSSAFVGHDMAHPCDSSNVCTPLSMAASGLAIMGRPTTPGNSWSDITEVYFEKGSILCNSVFFNEINLAFNNVGLDQTSSKAWILGNTTTGNYQVRVFDVTSNAKVTVPTAIQYLSSPNWVYVGGRIIRIRADKPGTGIIEVGTTIGAAQTEVIASEDHSYTEIALTSGPEQWDIREFKA